MCYLQGRSVSYWETYKRKQQEVKRNIKVLQIRDSVREYWKTKGQIVIILLQYGIVILLF